MPSSARALLVRLSAQQDLLLVALLVATIAMMILPLPTLLADLLIALNIGIAIVLMMVAVYIREAVELSTLPSIILVTTAFRLSLSITTSRMVLVQADAGDIIRTFGDFVIAGNVVVGLVVYLIITIVQFVVITKGSERVAEVAARFSLDALPGRQMSIDTDLKNGDIDQGEARRRRERLGRESQLYGAMDGAMKFVKGDAIASLVIIVVNLIGGITIGCMQRGLAFGDAVQTYSLLAVGDGLIAQIPALLISLTAGIVVTRVSGGGQAAGPGGGGSLGHDIVAQIASEPRTLAVAAAVLGALALVPGFPAAVFVCFAAVLAAAAWLVQARRRRDEDVRFRAELDRSEGRPVSVVLRVHLGEGLAALRPAVSEGLACAHEALGVRLGIAVPPLRLSPGADEAAALSWRVDVDGVPSLGGQIDPDCAFVEDAPAALDELAIPWRRAPGPFGEDSLVVDAAETAALREAGLLVVDAAVSLCREAERALLAQSRRFVGIQETQALLRAAEAHFPELVREATRACPLPVLTDVLRQLVEDQVPIANMRQILDTVLEWGSRDPGSALLAGHIRVALRRQICYSWSDSGKTLNALVVEGALEQTLRPRIPPTIQGDLLDGPAAKRLVESARDQLGSCLRRGRPAVVLVAPDLRRHLRKLLRQHGLEVAVMTFDEVAPEFVVRLQGTLRLSVVSQAPRPELVAQGAAD